ncbi:MAG TPA: isochorismatase [Gemmataceae bacterium]|nr:isochorismatase [Gemmataceae bacterium]
MMTRTLSAAILLAAVGVPILGAQKADFLVDAQKRVAVTETKNVAGKEVAVTQHIPVTFKATIDPKKSAVVVCDMWDDHWCKSASKRCGELAKTADPVLKACREAGMTIIHAPSDCMDFYKDHPARKRMLAVKKLDKNDLPKAKELPNPPLPVDDSDGGCDDDKPAKQFKAWTRQHAAIAIDDDKDYVSDNGVEAYSLMKEKGITTLFVMGVHTNMCVLNRSFAIKQMVKWGVATYLVRDLTDAMYNPKMKPFVTHEQGTNLIIEHIEAHWCPTITSAALKGK